VLSLDGRAVRHLAYGDRRALLEGLELHGAAWCVPPSFCAGREDLCAATREQHLKGVVFKHLDARWRAWASSSARGAVSGSAAAGVPLESSQSADELVAADDEDLALVVVHAPARAQHQHRDRRAPPPGQPAGLVGHALEVRGAVARGLGLDRDRDAAGAYDMVDVTGAWPVDAVADLPAVGTEGPQRSGDLRLGVSADAISLRQSEPAPRAKGAQRGADPE
jgi:hypothetical protein